MSIMEAIQAPLAVRRLRAATPERQADSLIRTLDLGLASVAILFLLPLMALTALAVWSQGGGPVLFRQQRIGRGGRLFSCLKFRTMATDAEARLPGLVDAEWRASRKFRHDVRVTRLGGLLRRGRRLG